jgi:Ohr subfamily peroxiredoxin
MNVLYTAAATAVGGRNGNVRSSDGVLELGLDVPESMGGKGGPGTNPEQLFAAGYGACFLSALSLVARSQKISAREFEVTVAVDIGPDDSGGFGLAVRLDCTMPNVEADKAAELVRTAHKVCPYSNATRGNIPVALLVGGQPIE